MNQKNKAEQGLEIIERWLTTKELKKLDIEEIEKLNPNFVEVNRIEPPEGGDSYEIINFNWNYALYKAAITELRNTYTMAYNKGLIKIVRNGEQSEEEE